MNHNGTSTSEPKNKRFQNSQPPLAQLPQSNVRLRDEQTQALQWKPGKKGEDFLPKIR